MPMSLRERLIEAREGWRAGRGHHIPPCCRGRWVISTFRPHPLNLLAPDLLRRLRGFRPRWVLADGVVPCELHLAWWVLTGRRPVLPERRRPPGSCCDYRPVMAERCGVDLHHDLLPVEGAIGPKDQGVWMLHIDGRETVSVLFCPWCGTALRETAEKAASSFSSSEESR